MAVKRYYEADKVDELLAKCIDGYIVEMEKAFESSNEHKQYELVGASGAIEYLKTRLDETSVRIRIKD